MISVVFDAVGPSASGQVVTSGTSLTWSHTCSGTNRLLVVGVTLMTNTTVTNVKYNGVTMTQISLGSIESGGNGQGSVQMYYLVNPPVGTSTVVVTSGATGGIIGGSTSFTNVNQAGPIGNVSTNFGHGANDGNEYATVAVASSPGNMVVDIAASGSAFGDTNQTSRWRQNHDTSSSAGNSAQATAAGAYGVVIAHNIVAGAGDDWAAIAAEIIAGGFAVAWMGA